MKRGYAGYGRPAQGSGRAGGKSEQLHKLGGILLTAVMLLGIGVSVWFGWAVRSGLRELARENHHRQELAVRHKKLLEERQALMKGERIEAMAAALDLFPAERRQIQRP